MIVSGDIVGGLGNHLFIIAAVLAYSVKYNKKVAFKYEENLGNRYNLPRKTFWKTLFKNQFELIESTEFDKIMFQLLFERYSHTYQELPITHRNLLLKGYFQSFKYINDDIKKRMTDIIYSNQDLMYGAYEKYNKIKSYFGCDDNDMVSVHIRRTDYCYGNFHKALDQTYYQRALEIAHKKNIIIFSDDIGWCKQNINKSWYEYDNIYFVEDSNDNAVELEFILMSMFQHNIIANSTFSLWASFISTYQEPKIVIAPKQWFGPEGPKDWEEIYHKNITNII
jgi:hypothetical protein